MTRPRNALLSDLAPSGAVGACAAPIGTGAVPTPGDVQAEAIVAACGTGRDAADAGGRA